MAKVELGFRAFDPHELLCHLTAARIGAYDGLDVSLRDLTFSEPPANELVQVSCGSALMMALHGEAQRVVVVTVDRPMFWLCSKADGNEPLEAVTAGSAIVTYPSPAPPAVFTRVRLRVAGLDPDVDLAAIPARDDAARIGLVTCGQAALAVISSAISPTRLQRSGVRAIAGCGDHLRIPTTGLAVGWAMAERESGAIEALAGGLMDGLDAVRRGAGAAVEALAGLLGESPEDAAAALKRWHSAFSADGVVQATEATAAVEAIRRELPGAGPLALGELYSPWS